MGFFKFNNKKSNNESDAVILEEIKSPWVNKKSSDNSDESFLNRKPLNFNGIDNVIKKDDKLEIKMEQLIKYTEYLSQHLDASIKYSEYLCEQIEILKRKR